MLPTSEVVKRSVIGRKRLKQHLHPVKRCFSNEKKEVCLALSTHCAWKVSQKAIKNDSKAAASLIYNYNCQDILKADSSNERLFFSLVNRQRKEGRQGSDCISS